MASDGSGYQSETPHLYSPHPQGRDCAGSTFGGNVPRYKDGYFGGNVITKIGLEFYPRENGNQKIYTHSGIILNDYNNYEFIPVEPINVEGINIYLSFL